MNGSETPGGLRPSHGPQGHGQASVTARSPSWGGDSPRRAPTSAHCQLSQGPWEAPVSGASEAVAAGCAGITTCSSNAAVGKGARFPPTDFFLLRWLCPGCWAEPGGGEGLP